MRGIGMLTPDSPLGQAIQKLLRDKPHGMSTDEVEVLLRRQGYQASAPSIDRVLSHRDVFLPLAGNRYALRSIIEATAHVESKVVL